MNLNEFLIELNSSIESEREYRKDDSDGSYPYPETIFTEKMLDFLASKSFIPEDYVLVYFQNAKYGKISGVAYSEDARNLYLINCIYNGIDDVVEVSKDKIKKEANRVYQFFFACTNGDLLKHAQPPEDVLRIASLLREKSDQIDTIGIYIITDGKVKEKKFNDLKLGDKTVKLSVMDLERYWSLTQGGNKQEIIIDFAEDFGKEPPCIYMEGKEGEEYDYALAIVPGDILNALYDEYGPRILEANVRSFLSFRGKVNKGIQKTLAENPENFFAFNNGLVIVADKIKVEKDTSTGLTKIRAVQGLQIVNGGQTTASMFFAHKKDKDIKLGKVSVAAKFIIPKQEESEKTESLYARISQFANTQNTVRVADLSSNSKLQLQIANLADRCILSDGISRVYYERTTGSFDVKLQKEASTRNQREKIKKLYSLVITKTDLAKYVNLWEKRPYEVTKGAQKNFALWTTRMEESLSKDNSQDDTNLLEKRFNEEWFKNVVAKAYLFKEVDKIIAKSFVFQSKSSVNAYTVSLISDKFSDLFNLRIIWLNRGLTEDQKILVKRIARLVNKNLVDNQNNRLFTEWAKKEECWDTLRAKGDAIRQEVLSSN